MRILITMSNLTHSSRLSTNLREAGLYKTFLAILNAEEDDFGPFSALYWFASDNHRGQTCPLYGVLSTVGYRPGAMESECPDEFAHHYDTLYRAWVKANKTRNFGG